MSVSKVSWNFQGILNGCRVVAGSFIGISEYFMKFLKGFKRVSMATQTDYRSFSEEFQEISGGVMEVILNTVEDYSLLGFLHEPLFLGDT